MTPGQDLPLQTRSVASTAMGGSWAWVQGISGRNRKEESTSQGSIDLILKVISGHLCCSWGRGHARRDLQEWGMGRVTRMVFEQPQEKACLEFREETSVTGGECL